MSAYGRFRDQHEDAFQAYWKGKGDLDRVAREAGESAWIACIKEVAYRSASERDVEKFNIWWEKKAKRFGMTGNPHIAARNAWHEAAMPYAPD